jgi:hypothetical protein
MYNTNEEFYDLVEKMKKEKKLSSDELVCSLTP